jgi:thiol-disulfide isomerase/thioredoxin
MTFESKVAIILALLAVAIAAGSYWKVQTGRARAVKSGSLVDLNRLQATKNGKPVQKFGAKATLLQFSTEVCSICAQTSKYFGQLEKKHSGLLHIEVDVTHRMDLAAHFNVLQTPTTLLLDQDGKVRARIGGAPKPQTLLAELEKLNVSNT